jgi:hypothetical protein
MPNTDGVCWFASTVAASRKVRSSDESWDGALMSPDGRRDEEWEEGAILDWHAPMQRQHLCEDLEDIRYVFCDKSISDGLKKLLVTLDLCPFTICL